MFLSIFVAVDNTVAVLEQFKVICQLTHKYTHKQVLALIHTVIIPQVSTYKIISESG